MADFLVLGLPQEFDESLQIPTLKSFSLNYWALASEQSSGADEGQTPHPKSNLVWPQLA